MEFASPLAKVLAAAHFAAESHAEQRRKGVRQEPYVNHLIEVAELVAGAAPADADLIAAALLHDTIEDAGVTQADIAARFGADVATLVAEVSDDKNLPRAARKAAQIANARHNSPRAQVLKIADKISNLRSVIESPPTGWDFVRRREYFDWARQVVDALPAPPPALKARFDELYRSFETSRYLAYRLTHESRQQLLERFKPRYANVKAHHITVKYPATEADAFPDEPLLIRAVGYADSGDGVEAVAVEIDGSTARPDGVVYHVTLSLAPGRRSHEANDLLRRGYRPVTPLRLEAHAEVLP